MSHKLPSPLLLLLCLTSVLVVMGCHRITLPAISNVHIEEILPATLKVTAIISGSEIEECGICYSTTNTSPTLESNDGIIYGSLEGDRFTVRVTLKPKTAYYIAVFATNEAGRTTSTSMKFTTGVVNPDIKDNPFPGTGKN